MPFSSFDQPNVTYHRPLRGHAATHVYSKTSRGGRHEPLGCHLPWRGFMTPQRFSTWLPPFHERGRGWLPFGSQDSLLHFWLERSSPPEPLIPGAPKGIIFPGVATGLCLLSALGCHLHERGRGWPPFSYRGADGLQPILVTCMSRGNEARIWSGHHLQNDLCLARLRSAPILCMTAPRFSTWLPSP